MTGKLIIFPNSFIDEQPIDNLMPIASVVEKAKTVQRFIFESKRSGFRFVAKLKVPELKTLPYHELNEHTKLDEKKEIQKHLLAGETLGLISDAGMPCVADPGSDLVLFCRLNKIPVDTLVGPSSILLALIGSGLNGQRFHFEGYLPKEEEVRKKRVEELISRSKVENCTILCIEAPYRNNQLLKQLLRYLPKDFYLSVAADLTLPTQHVETSRVENFSSQMASIEDRPAIFLFYRPEM